MLVILQKKVVINFILIISIIILSTLSIHWHHEMYLLHREEKTLKSENEKINAINNKDSITIAELTNVPLISLRLAGRDVLELKRNLFFLRRFILANY